MTLVFASFAWGSIAYLLYWVIKSTQSGVTHIKTLHKIRCSTCIYHTNCSALKCTLHPYQARTEAAIICPDYDATPELL